MKKVLLFIISFIYAISIASQTVTIIDKIDTLGIENVSISSNGKYVKTDKQGKADISIFSTKDVLLIESVGYEPLKIPFQKLKKNNFKVKIHSEGINLDAATISAIRWEDLKNGSPNQIVGLYSKEIAFSNVQTTADLLGQSHSVYIQKSQLGGGSPMIRGFSTNRVLLVVDGVRMNNAIFRSGNLQNVISLDALSTNSTSILMGPGSVIYGSDAIGGVMNFYTLTPSLSSSTNNFTASAFTRYSSANSEKTGHLHFAIRTRKWGFLSSATYSDFGDLQMGSINHDEYTRPEYVERINGIDSIYTNTNKNVQSFTGYNQINLMQKIRFVPNDKLDIRYGLHYSKLSDVPRYDRLIEYKNDKLIYADWYYGPQKWLMNSLNIFYNDTCKVFDKLSFTVAHQLYEESRNDRKIGKTELRQKTENVSAFSANIDFEKNLSNKHDLAYGLEFVNNLVNSKGEMINILDDLRTPDASRYPDGSTYSSYAAYLSWKIRLNNNLRLNSGLRYNYTTIDASFDTTYYKFPFTVVNTKNGSVNGSVGLIYNPQPLWFFRLNLSTGFRSPNIDDIGKVFDSEPGNVVVPNPDLKPEYAYNIDFSIIRQFADKGKIEMSAFYLYLDDAIVRRDFLFDGNDSIEYSEEMSKVQALVNTSNAYSFGFQLSFDIEFARNFFFQTYLSYTKGEEQDEETGEYVPLRHAPPIFGSTHFIYQNAKFKTDLYADYNSEISTKNLAPSEKAKPVIYATDNNGNPYCPGWYTVNFKVSYQINNYLQVNGGIENLFDVRYRPYSSGIVAPGRNFIISAKCNF